MTTKDAIGNLLRKLGLRDTQTRRSVLQALQSAAKPMSPGDIRERIVNGGNAINTVTVYRILEVLVKLGAVHRHPYNGLFTACTMPDTPGHHGFLHCDDCGKTEEFHDERLCHIENSIAKQSGYIPRTHISEIRGTCSHCS
ncbi:MAG TPA: Fur family transcriptional regulator [Candidatus Peribacteria bacterium]|nr:Fur family transcriptional regulator [Candidatus Peribacteria bacterium]